MAVTDSPCTRAFLYYACYIINSSAHVLFSSQSVFNFGVIPTNVNNKPEIVKCLGTVVQSMDKLFTG